MKRESFLPEDLRPSQSGERSPRSLVGGLLAVLALAVLTAAVPQYRLRTVQVNGGEILPESTLRSLEDLVGNALVVLDLDRVRQQVLVWPRVGAVDVQLELIGVLHVEVAPVTVKASIPVGGRWRGIAGDGSPAGALEISQKPVLVDFPEIRSELRRGLAVAERLGRTTGRSVQRIRRITPADMEVQLSSAEEHPSVYVRVTPAGSRAEDIWCEGVLAGVEPAPWSDVRRDDRIVIGSLS